MILVSAVILLIAVTFAVLGCLCIWNGYTYFVDGFIHASLLISVLNSISCLNGLYSSAIFSVVFASIVYKYGNSEGGAVGVSLASNMCLSLGLILSYLFPTDMKVNNLLLGDPLYASIEELKILFPICVISIGFVYLFSNRMLLVLLNRDLARVMNARVGIISFAFLVLLSFSALVAVKTVGVLMSTSILLLPAVIARSFARTASGMIRYAVLVSLGLSMISLIISFYCDLPAPPLITAIGSLTYIGLKIFRLIKS